uniref:Uncharacterized protein n=1 Tax=Chromera velia CCMP2878 TaxID=1169474 RepID=A0A0G4I6H7_9ALVE|eukprot:Cvel_11370.t1-p1 / transcript=Cvel_11370.t1 / gene=Cvel_11370 / organism=Chromera_velia_CCMP2878 / gene_product=hypothetical protein / transcript_product=hypothetical protein / location=Cvel_scaffold712:66904-70480(-) / protein_length=638 / sequence_SO=supercontig / SO=protein_coding / is_pseudo=false
MQRRDEAIVNCQRHIRGYLARKRYVDRLFEAVQAEKTYHAIQIQRAFRRRRSSGGSRRSSLSSEKIWGPGVGPGTRELEDWDAEESKDKGGEEKENGSLSVNLTAELDPVKEEDQGGDGEDKGRAGEGVSPPSGSVSEDALEPGGRIGGELKRDKGDDSHAFSLADASPPAAAAIGEPLGIATVSGGATAIVGLPVGASSESLCTPGVSPAIFETREWDSPEPQSLVAPVRGEGGEIDGVPQRLATLNVGGHVEGGAAKRESWQQNSPLGSADDALGVDPRWSSAGWDGTGEIDRDREAVVESMEGELLSSSAVGLTSSDTEEMKQEQRRLSVENQPIIGEDDAKEIFQSPGRRNSATFKAAASFSEGSRGSPSESRRGSNASSPPYLKKLGSGFVRSDPLGERNFGGEVDGVEIAAAAKEGLLTREKLETLSKEQLDQVVAEVELLVLLKSKELRCELQEKEELQMEMETLNEGISNMIAHAAVEAGGGSAAGGGANKRSGLLAPAAAASSHSHSSQPAASAQAPHSRPLSAASSGHSQQIQRGGTVEAGEGERPFSASRERGGVIGRPAAAQPPAGAAPTASLTASASGPGSAGSHTGPRSPMADGEEEPPVSPPSAGPSLTLPLDSRHSTMTHGL